jgi:hypothetical protein
MKYPNIRYGNLIRTPRCLSKSGDEKIGQDALGWIPVYSWRRYTCARLILFPAMGSKQKNMTRITFDGRQLYK